MGPGVEGSLPWGTGGSLGLSPPGRDLAPSRPPRAQKSQSLRPVLNVFSSRERRGRTDGQIKRNGFALASSGCPPLE